jgi:flagellar biosynthesis protein FlhB
MAEGGEKTEEPTPHRLREAREKGQISKSKEITTALLLVSSYMIFRYTGAFVWQQLVTMANGIFVLIPASFDFSLDFVVTLMVIAARGFFFAVLPLFAMGFMVAIIAEALQTGFVSSMDPLTPKVERINPLEGFKRMFSMTGMVELLKSIIKIAIVFWITFRALMEELPKVLTLTDLQPWDAIVIGGDICYKIAMRVGAFYVFIAVLDYFYRRWEYMKNLKMSHQEVKEEYKRLEGDPLVKQRIRDMQRAVAQQRMMGAVPSADVVVTNPTHLAVALQYDAAHMKAPTLLAKGENLVAEKIKQIADDNRVPIIENETLARSIYKSTNIGQEVPFEFYQAVAEVLAFVYKTKQKRAGRLKTSAVPPA